jgi:hypothetical protein
MKKLSAVILTTAYSLMRWEPSCISHAQFCVMECLLRWLCDKLFTPSSRLVLVDQETRSREIRDHIYGECQGSSVKTCPRGKYATRQVSTGTQHTTSTSRALPPVRHQMSPLPGIWLLTTRSMICGTQK